MVHYFQGTRLFIELLIRVVVGSIPTLTRVIDGRLDDDLEVDR